jgi:hypothetical protein
MVIESMGVTSSRLDIVRLRQQAYFYPFKEGVIKL